MITAACPACPKCRVPGILERDHHGTPWMSCPLCHDILNPGDKVIVLLVDQRPPDEGGRAG